MTSIPKILVRPRLQLLMLVLVLGGGSLPKNSMAEEEAGANPDHETGAPEESPSDVWLAGRAGKPPVKCWVDECEGSAACLKTPAEREAETFDCPNGCFQALFSFKNEQYDTEVRNCALPQVLKCFDAMSTNFTDLHFFGGMYDKHTRRQSQFLKCIDDLKPEKDKYTGEEETGPGKMEARLCDTDLCNGVGNVHSPSVKCWKQSFEKSLDCLKKPTDATQPGVSIVDCPSGYCFEAVNNFGDKQGIEVTRRCAEAEEVTCLQERPGKCEKLQLTGDKGKDAGILLKSEFRKCQKEVSKSAGKEGTGSGPGTMEVCLCYKDHCNGGTPGPGAKSTGVKQLGYNVAIVGALLVAAFPLRTLFLVGRYVW